MKRTRRKIDSALKVKIVFEALRRQKPIAELAQQYGLHPNQIYGWKKQLENFAIFAFNRETRIIAQLKDKVRRVDTVAVWLIALKIIFPFVEAFY
jgi:transposase-like protein